MTSSIPDEVVARLGAAGFSPTTISSALALPLPDVRKILVEHDLDPGTPETDDIQVAVRRLVMRVIGELDLMLDEAAPPVKQRLLSNMFTRLLPMMNDEDATGMEDIRGHLDDLLAEFRGDDAA